MQLQQWIPEPKGDAPPITDADLRPWAYTVFQAEHVRTDAADKVSSAKQEEADRKLTSFMMG